MIHEYKPKPEEIERDVEAAHADVPLSEILRAMDEGFAELFRINSGARVPESLTRLRGKVASLSVRADSLRRGGRP